MAPLNLPTGFDEVHPVHCVHGIIGNEKNGIRFGSGKRLEGGSGVMESFHSVTERLKDNGGEFEQHGFVIDDVDELGVGLRLRIGGGFTLVHVDGDGGVNTEVRDVASVQNGKGKVKWVKSVNKLNRVKQL